MTKHSTQPNPPSADSVDVSQIQWLAGLAMQATIEQLDALPDTDSEREEIALWSYRMAEAMIKMESRIRLKSNGGSR